MSLTTTIECPICYKNVKNYVHLECNHKCCLDCHLQLMMHSHHKCSLCRLEIEEMHNPIFTLTTNIEVRNNMILELRLEKEAAKSQNKMLTSLCEIYKLLLNRVQRNIEREQELTNLLDSTSELQDIE